MSAFPKADTQAGRGRRTRKPAASSLSDTWDVANGGALRNSDPGGRQNAGLVQMHGCDVRCGQERRRFAMRRFATFAVAFVLAAANAAYAAPPPATGTPTSAAGSRDRIICRRFVRIGSLVDGYRTCKTRAEWDREQANARQFSVSDSCSLRGDPDPARGAHAPDC
jgi:hypothetical protein